MKKTLQSLSIIIAAFMVLVVLSCKKDASCEGCNAVNRPPVAIAGSDRQINLPSDSVRLNGSASYDPDGNITAWSWSKIGGPASFQVNRMDSVVMAVTMLVQGVYQFELKVTDDKGLSAKDTIQITVNSAGVGNRPPVACAGQDQNFIYPVNSVLLDGSCSTDPDNNITSYQWTKISGSSLFNIADVNEIQTQVNNLGLGTYQFQLKVRDAQGLVSLDTVKITVSLPASNPPVDIYVTGHENFVAKYWKNGHEVLLPSQSQFSGVSRAIAISGNDVYVAGEEGDFFSYGQNRAKYWKNGQEVLLTGAVGAGTTSIAISGADVYVAGWEIGGGGVFAKYWKNGQSINLTYGSTDAMANCIVVVGNDVYVAGYENGIAKYWKNGLAVPLTSGLYQAYANSIAIVGSDIYVAGSEANDSVHVAKYWKNGQPVMLTNGTQHAMATSIVISGSDVYVAGYEGNNNTIAKYWKNGQPVPLTTSGSAYASSIALFGSDVYVAGYDNGPSYFSAKFWKNGQAVPLTVPNGSWATSILVVPQ